MFMTQQFDFSRTILGKCSNKCIQRYVQGVHFSLICFNIKLVKTKGPSAEDCPSKWCFTCTIAHNIPFQMRCAVIWKDLKKYY